MVVQWQGSKALGKRAVLTASSVAGRKKPSCLFLLASGSMRWVSKRFFFLFVLHCPGFRG
jgi:hypothetical protein